MYACFSNLFTVSLQLVIRLIIGCEKELLLPNSNDLDINRYRKGHPVWLRISAILDIIRCITMQIYGAIARLKSRL